MKPEISIIIPTLNEEGYLSQTIECLNANADHTDQIEVIVVDAGSTDNTLDSVKALEVKTFSKGEFLLQKYKSLNFGIEQATGETLIFLDADTFLPKGFDELIRKKLEDQKIVGGAFEFAFKELNWKLKFLQMVNRIRYRIDGMYYGDQAIFCRREVAVSVGGYPEKQLMESAYFCKKLRTKGKLNLIKTPIQTSPRRFNQHGFYKVFWFDFIMWVRFSLNISVEEFGKRYWGLNMRSDG